MNAKTETARVVPNGTTPGQHPLTNHREEHVTLSRFDPSDLMPRSWSEARELSSFLCKAGMLPDHLRGNEANVFLTILAGLELGISPLVACREIYFVKGRPNISSRLKVAMVRSSPVCRDYEEVESTVKKAVVRGRRVGQERWTVKEFTIEDAKTAELLGNDNWRKYPKDMLLHRANGRLCDDLWQDVTRGMRSKEEVDDEREVAGERILPPDDPNLSPPPRLEVVDPVTGEVTEGEVLPARPFDALAADIATAADRQGLMGIVARINAAKSDGKVSVEEVTELQRRYKAQLDVIGGAK
jgi:hypothetical protein